MTTSPDTSWRAFLAEGGIALPVFIGGVALQAMEAFIGTAMLPTVVRDIGGLDYFAWNSTLFIVASIAATVFAAVRPAHIGPRDVYIIAAAGFGVGSLICGMAPNMVVLLLGRTVQGFGAGLIIATTYAMIRIVFSQPLWPRAMALNSMVWGVATLLGPAVGGIFANYDLWRWAFLCIVPIAAVLAVAAVAVLPRREAKPGDSGMPVVQIALVIAAILLISIASLVTGSTMLSIGFLCLAALAIVALAWIDARAGDRLLPDGALKPGTALNILIGAMVLVGISITSDIFVPLFLQQLHGQTPLWAGYITALVAAGWTIASVATSGYTGTRARAAIVLSPVAMTIATIGLALFLAAPDTVANLVLAGLSLLLLGAGIGGGIQHLTAGVLASGTAAENDRVSAMLGMLQLFASGIGAAIGGVVVNAAGLPEATGRTGIETAASWLYWVFAAITALAIPFALRVVRTAPHLRTSPAE